MTFCYCGAERGYPHPPGCPWPLFVDAGSREWQLASELLKRAHRVMQAGYAGQLAKMIGYNGIRVYDGVPFGRTTSFEEWAAAIPIIKCVRFHIARPERVAYIVECRPDGEIPEVAGSWRLEP